MFVESKEPSYSIEELRKPPGNLEKLESETRYLLFLSFHHLLSNKNSPHSRKMEENSFLPALRLLLVSTPTPNSCSLRTPIAKPKSDPKSEAPPKPPVDSKLETAKPKRTPPPREVRRSAHSQFAIQPTRKMSAHVVL